MRIVLTEEELKHFLSFLDIPKEDKENSCWLWKGKTNRNGYGYYSPGNGSYWSAHCFSFQVFKGDIPKGLFILHSCNTSKCSNPNHLRAGTKEENTADAIKAGRIRRGEGHHLTKFTDQQVIEIKELIAKGYLNKEIALKFNCSSSYVSMIAQNRCRREILKDKNFSTRDSRKLFGEAHPRTKYSDELIEKVRELNRQGCSKSYISFKTGFNSSMVNSIIKNRWRKKKSLPKLTLGDIDSHLTSTSSDVVPVIPT